MSFTLARARGSVHVTRSERWEDGSTWTLSIMFETPERFRAWVGADEALARHPHQLDELSRSGCSLFDAEHPA